MPREKTRNRNVVYFFWREEQRAPTVTGIWRYLGSDPYLFLYLYLSQMRIILIDISLNQIEFYQSDLTWTRKRKMKMNNKDLGQQQRKRTPRIMGQENISHQEKWNFRKELLLMESLEDPRQQDQNRFPVSWGSDNPWRASRNRKKETRGEICPSDIMSIHMLVSMFVWSMSYVNVY